MTNELGDARIRLPARIRKGETIMVHTIVTHPMDTGLFRDADGNPIAAWWVKDVQVTYAGVEVARFEWTPGVSRDPVVSFPLKADREGTLDVVWTDSKGAIFRQSARIAFDAA